MQRKGVTLQLLWLEYETAHPDGYQYSRPDESRTFGFCELYRAWQGKLDLVMRHDHKAGEKLFVDYAGQTAELTPRRRARCAPHRSSWRCSAPPTTPTPRRRARRPFRTG